MSTGIDQTDIDRTRPATPGMALADVDTPALLLDLDAFEANVACMQSFADGAGLRLRPHAKTHKCPAIARYQIAAGAIGVCCQKVSEAEILVDGGVADILVSNEVVGQRKLARLAELARRARIGVCVDHPQQVRDLEAALGAAGATIDVLVEVDVGAGRCGVQPGEPALALARQIVSSECLNLGGLQAYHGRAQHLRSPGERQAAIAEAARLAAATRDALEAEGISCPVVTGAGTGTFECEAMSGVYGELQVGSYIFMDGDYAANDVAQDSLFRQFQHSLHVLATVMSCNHSGQAVLDAGLKAFSVDSGMPLVAGHPQASVLKASDEHGVVSFAPEDAAEFTLGNKVRLVPGHCDPTVNLYDWLVCYRGNNVEDVWRISARGALL